MSKKKSVFLSKQNETHHWHVSETHHWHVSTIYSFCLK